MSKPIETYHITWYVNKHKQLLCGTPITETRYYVSNKQSHAITEAKNICEDCKLTWVVYNLGQE